MFIQILRDFQIESIGFFAERFFSKKHDFKGERHEFIEIVYVHSGSVQVVENENVYILNGGDLVVHGPMEFHRIRSFGETEPHVFNISITVAGRLPTQLLAGVFHLDRQLQEDFLECAKMTGQLFDSQHSDIYQGQRTAERLALFLMELCRQKANREAGAMEGSARIYGQLVKDMQETVCLDLDLDEIAARNYISISYLKKLFHQYANTTPKDFYDDLRIKYAIARLQEGIPVTEIAETMGFSSPNFFATFFKRHMGITPSAYKKNMR